jgi:hypothetical protein
MHHSHQLEKQTHQDFLVQQRVDPITGERIEAGHKIVICSACKSAFFEESWEYLGGKHCNQEKTLSKIPVAQTLWLKAKPLEFLPFDFEGFDKKLHYQNVIYGFLELVIIALSGFSVLFWLVSLIKSRQDIFIVSIFVGMSSAGLYFNLKKIIKKLPVLIHKHILPIDREHKLAIDNKKQVLVFRNDFKELKLPLNTISKFQYSFNYVDEDTSRYRDMCDLIVTLGFSKNGIYKERTISTQIRKVYFYKWEELLNKLPLGIKVYLRS